MAPFISALLRANRTEPYTLLLEPFCGGASVALHAAGTGVAERIILADANPLVASFWYTAAFDTAWLISAMREESVTLARWDWWKAAEPASRRDRALKCLFLNRTSFSGVFDAHAGPIGGRAQTSKYKIDCRFGKDGLARRIAAVGDLADTGRLLSVWQCDWHTSLRRVATRIPEAVRTSSVAYLDPPYVAKASELYGWSFDGREHQRLAATLSSDRGGLEWVLSYDDRPETRAWYPARDGIRRALVPFRYTASSERRDAANELVVTTLSELPAGTGATDLT